MAIDLTTKTADELKTLLANHERLGRTTAPLYLAAGAELARRTSGSLSLDRTVEIIAEAAKAGRLLAYKDISDKSGAVWAKVRHKMPAHLLDVCAHGNRNGLPMLSSIVVNKLVPGTGGGVMEPGALAGFCQAARDMGLEVGDEAAFLKEQQIAVFAAAKDGRLP